MSDIVIIQTVFFEANSISSARESVDFESIKNHGVCFLAAMVNAYINEGRMFEENAASALINKVQSLIISRKS